MSDLTVPAALPAGTAPARHARPRLRLGAWTGLVLPVLCVAAWQMVADRRLVAPDLLPAPAAVLRALADLAASGELVVHLEATLGRMALGFAAGAAVGTLAGALTGAIPLARRLVDPTVQALRSVPSIAWVPLFIIWLGIFEGSKIALIAVGVFFPVYLNLMSGIAGVDRKLIEVGRVHGFSPLRVLWRIQLPAVLPAYVTGLRGGLGLGWMFVAAAELMGASEGLGFLLTDGEQTGRPAVVIGAILLFAICGKLTDLGVEVLGGRLVAWQDTVQP
jgi:sulfonate transport system permease protein